MNGKEVTLNIISDDGGGSSIFSNLPHATGPVIKEKVEAKTLDSFNLDNIGFLKLDVEGAELEVLQGAVKTLARSQYPPFIFEVWPDKWYQTKKEKLFNYVKGLGYTITPITGVNNMFLASH